MRTLLSIHDTFCHCEPLICHCEPPFVIANLLLSLRAQRSNLPFEYYGTPCYTRIHHAFLLHPVDCFVAGAPRNDQWGHTVLAGLLSSSRASYLSLRASYLSF